MLEGLEVFSSYLENVLELVCRSLAWSWGHASHPGHVIETSCGDLKVSANADNSFFFVVILWWNMIWFQLQCSCPCGGAVKNLDALW